MFPSEEAGSDRCRDHIDRLIAVGLGRSLEEDHIAHSTVVGSVADLVVDHR